jgi:hypothetical protein
MWNVWYLDDGLLVGDPLKIAHALEWLEAEFGRRGLSINWGKTILWGPGAHLIPQGQRIQVVPWERGSGVTVLGRPITYPDSTTYLHDQWELRLQHLEDAAHTVTQLADKQMAHHLLRFCLDACKVNHLLRMTDPYECLEYVSRADDIVLSAFEDIVGCALT